MRSVVTLLCALSLAACQTGPMRLVDAPGEKRVTPGDVIGVALSEPDRLEPWHSWVGKSRVDVDTGAVWRSVFVGRAGTPTFRILKTELRHTNAAAGFAGRYTYTVDGELVVDGKAHPISATGSRGFSMAMESAMRQSVELAVVDAANSCRAILKQ